MIDPLNPWVVVTRTGSVGQVERTGHIRHRRGEQALVQFGASGPFRWIATHRLRPATEEDRAAAGLEGVG